MEKSYVISHMRIWCKIFCSVLGIGGVCYLFSEISKYSFDLSNILILRSLLSSIVLLAFSIGVLLFSVKFNTEGLTVQIGLDLKRGNFLGIKICKKWKELEIRLWSTWPNPTIALHKNRMPALWWALNSHYNDCMRIIAKYGKDRMMDEETRKYFKKFEEIE